MCLSEGALKKGALIKKKYKNSAKNERTNEILNNLLMTFIPFIHISFVVELSMSEQTSEQTSHYLYSFPKCTDLRVC